jgi:uroporphyrin-III C-methyltransferase / precorrin-2 dehydrogenase / sirohydrochlorin ferrochelatase
MRHFPIFLNLSGRRALVLGGSEAARRKAEPLLRAGADVRFAERFEPLDLEGCVLAVGADAPEAELLALSMAARTAGIPVNIVDRPELCSFIMPAIIDRDPVMIAVSSSGTAPVLARLLRARVEAVIPPAYGRLAALADTFKAEIRRRLPDLAQRRRVLERLFTGRTADLVFAGRDGEARASFAAALEESAPTAGMVFLVGAGPGAADLLTLRAQRLLGEADVIVHDRLVSEAVLDMARRDAHRICVGGTRARPSLSQDAINGLLVALAQAGKKVIRLQGGDPFLFGRGDEEAAALASADVTFEVVPGVTTALACAAQAGIPLTGREVASAVTLATGHLQDGAIDLAFAPLVQSRATLAVYMAVAALPQLRAGLLTNGLEAGTPAVLIENGGRPEQRERYGTLDELVAQAPEWTQGGPTIVIVGQTVARRIRSVTSFAPA